MKPVCDFFLYTSIIIFEKKTKEWLNNWLLWFVFPLSLFLSLTSPRAMVVYNIAEPPCCFILCMLLLVNQSASFISIFIWMFLLLVNFFSFHRQRKKIICEKCKHFISLLAVFVGSQKRENKKQNKMDVPSCFRPQSERKC